MLTNSCPFERPRTQATGGSHAGGEKKGKGGGGSRWEERDPFLPLYGTISVHPCASLGVSQCVCVEGWDGGIDGWRDGGIKGWTDGWMDGCVGMHDCPPAVRVHLYYVV